jgi:thiamine-phosphate diphosphorylase
VLPLPRLIALSPGTLTPGGAPGFLAALARARAAGLPGLLLREPGLSDRDFLALARAARARVPWFALHDRAHLAAEVGADAVHLGFRSLRPRELPWLPSGILRGLSTHAHDDASTWAGAHYVFHGPLRSSPEKPELLGLGFEGFQRARTRIALPILALGGVGPADARELRALGLHGAAVRAGILLARDPASATRAYLEALA